MKLANKIFDAFDCIKMDPKLKESTKQFLSEKRRKKSMFFQRLIVKRTIRVVCAMLLLAIGIGGYSWFQAPVSYVSIDVNPSIELALNRLNKVVTATAYNEEGEGVLKGLSLKGKLYTNAIDAVINCEEMRRYLTDESELFLTVAADQSHENKIKTGVESYLGTINQDCQYNSTKDIEIVLQAHKYGLSLGKYYLYLKLDQYDDTITLDDCKHMSMSEIDSLIKEHEKEEAFCPTKENEDDHKRLTPSNEAMPQKETARPQTPQDKASSAPNMPKETSVIDMATPQPQEETPILQQPEAPVMSAVPNQEAANDSIESDSCSQQPEHVGGGCTFTDENHDGFCDNGDIHSHNGDHVDENGDGFCDYGDRYCMKGSDAGYDGACDNAHTAHEGAHQYNSDDNNNSNNNNSSDNSSNSNNNGGDTSENTGSGSHHSKKHGGSHHR